MKWLRSLLALLAIGLSAPAMAQSLTVAGVKYEDSIELRGTKLQLNGAGIRYKGPFKVYTAGLYTTKKAGSPEEVLATPGPKRMSITMLREIDSSELGKLFSRGMEDNMDKAAFSKLIPGGNPSRQSPRAIARNSDDTIVHGLQSCDDIR